MSQVVHGRLVLDDDVASGALTVEDGVITEVDLDARSTHQSAQYIAPGFVDVHVHGWGGFSAMGGSDQLDGMSRSLMRHGVTSFLPTAVTSPIEELSDFGASVRAWAPDSPADGAQPLGFNLEGPFLAPKRKGAHNEAFLRVPADVSRHELAGLTEQLRLVTVAPELNGAIELIVWLVERGVAVSAGHSNATHFEALAGYAAGARSTTHIFNAMSGIDHRDPGVAVAALMSDQVYVELIADGIHVDRALWPLISRLKGSNRLMLVSDALSLAGTGDGRGMSGTLEVEVRDGRVTVAGTSTLAGSVLSLDVAVRNLVESGASLPSAVAAASRNPLAMLGITDRGRLAPGQRADIVELNADLSVSRVMRAGAWMS
jgi:N-acetylglucosamine-6-phosphate deacetylase